MSERSKNETQKTPRRLHRKQVVIAIVIALVVLVVVIMVRYVMPVKTAGLNSVAVALANGGVNTTSDVTVSFEVAGLAGGDTIKIYLGDNSAASHEWQIESVVGTDIACLDDGTGENYGPATVTAASATVPMFTEISVVGVGAGATTVTCTIGGTNKPKNPDLAGSYSVAVVTTDASGAGIAYVGDANKVTVSTTVLPNLALTITDGATGCATTAGITACDLGVVTIAAVKSGSYRVKVGTNADSGAALDIDDDGDLRNVAASEAINDVADGAVTLGNEEYGISVTETGTAWTLTSPYDSGDNPIGDALDEVATTAGPVSMSTDYVEVTHKVAVSSATKALTYSHIVSWTATATF